MTIFDAHCDTIYQCYHQDASLLKDNPNGHLDLRRIRPFANYAQFFALFEDAKGKHPAELKAIFTAQHRIFCRELEQNQDAIRFCRTKDDILCAWQERKAAALLSVEGADLLGCSISSLERAYALGVRAVNLTWNRANVLSGSVKEEPKRGLSPLGRTFVQRMQDLGMLVDVSHLSDVGFWDVIELAHKPIMASHSNARALCVHPRNLSDEQFTAVMRTGGVVGLNLYTAFLGQSPTLDTVTAQIDHFWALGGVDHIALGGDWDGCDSLPTGFEDGISGLAGLYEHLLRRNFSESDINKLFYQNLVRVVGDVCTM